MIEVLENSLMARVAGEKQFDESNAHIDNLELHIQTMEVDNAELASKNEILRLELQQAIDAKQIAEETVKLAEVERAAFGGESPAAGAGRSSAMLRQTLGADVRYCIVADIVDALKEAPIRTGANAVLDQELKDTLSVVADLTRGDLSWAAEARLSRLVSERHAGGRNGFVHNTHRQGWGESRETGRSHRHKNGGFRTFL
jgi:hypothetical protein